MSVVLPFCGLRLDQEKGGPIQSFLAPPYDVVTEQERDRIVSASRHNIFSLELPSKEDGYESAAALLRRWIEEGVLRFDQSPCLYPYHIEFQVKGQNYCRKGFVAAVRIEEWECGTIRPHELTFGHVTSERLRLLEATQTQFSQIFLLYRNNPVPSQILDSIPWERLCEVKDGGGNSHIFGRFSQIEAAKEICRSFSSTPLYIADGHHRYTTALEFKRQQVKRHGNHPSMPYLYQMAYLVDADDPGLVVLPTHRIISSMGPDERKTMAEARALYFEIERFSGDRSSLVEVVEAELNRPGGGMKVAVVCGWQPGVEVWHLKEESRKRLLTAKLPPQLAELDVSMFDQVIMEEVLKMDTTEAEKGGRVSFNPDAKDAASRLREDQVLFILRPTPAHQVMDVADAGLTMPHKSTFFYPKILTGLVMNSVEPGRRMQTADC